MKKSIICLFVLVFIMNLCGCAVVESVKDVATPLQTPPPLKDTEILEPDPTIEPISEPIIEAIVESVEKEEPQETPTPTPAPQAEETNENALVATDIFEKRSDDLYIECLSQFDTDAVEVDAYISGGNINAVIKQGNTPINAIVNENSEYVYIYLDKSFIGAKVTGFEEYSPLKYEDIILQNASSIEDLCADENGVNEYEAVRGIFEYNDKDYVVWYSQEYDIALKVEINQNIVYEIKKVRKIDNMDMNLFEKPKSKMFVDFGDISELSIQEIMGFFS